MSNRAPSDLNLPNSKRQKTLNSYFSSKDPTTSNDSNRASSSSDNADTSTCAPSNLDLSQHPSENPTQPHLSNFPPSKNNRRFSATYYTTYPWIEYSIKEDAVFCFPCRHFQKNSVTRGEKFGDIAFIDRGFSKWKDAGTLLSKHAKSSRHSASMIAMGNFKKVREGSQKSVLNQINDSHQLEVQSNRKFIGHLITAISYLGRQELALRGHDESNRGATDSDADFHNRGNLIELLDVFSGFDDLIKRRLYSKYGHYVSPNNVNDLINCIATVVRRQIVSDIDNFWSLMVDEARDVSRKEQLSFSVRYLSRKTGLVCEKSLATCHLTSFDANALVEAINKIRTNIELEWERCVGQCYDGASVMSGAYSGVQAKIKEIAPWITYTHCHAHRLNLVLLNSINNLPYFADFFSILQQLYVFISNSNTRHELFVKVQEEMNIQVMELERLVHTRWFYWHKSTKKCKQRFEAIFNTLTILSEQPCHRDVASEASSLMNRITDYNFLETLVICDFLLSQINVLSKELQARNINVSSAQNLIQLTTDSLKRARNEQCHQNLKIEIQQLGSSIGLECLSKPAKRKQKASKKLLDFYVLSSTGARTHEVDNQSEAAPVFFTAIDRFVTELNRRFLLESHAFTAQSIFDHRSLNFLSEEKSIQLLKAYPHCDIDEVALSSELITAKDLMAGSKQEREDIISIYKLLNEFPCGFQQLLKLIKLIIVLPVTTVTNERHFSNMKRVKNFLRNSMGDERLSDLLVMACLKEECKQVNIDAVIDEFARRKDRRYSLM